MNTGELLAPLYSVNPLTTLTQEFYMKLPPYGKPLRALLDGGKLPSNCIYLYIGKNSWEKGRLSSISRPSNTLALPLNHHPLTYQWPVKRCDILVIETTSTDQDYIENLVSILFASGANSIALIASDFSTSFYKKDF